MKKLVPDPPATLLRTTTTHTPFSFRDGNHTPLFAVCAGADMEDALVQLSVLLRSAYETNFQACETADTDLRGLLWATQHTLEASRALAESLLTGIEAQPPLR